MSHSKGNTGAVGFVTVVKAEDLGYVGGLLVVNSLGRPLEFHATAPVRPSRAHEILYGATLVPFLMGERMTTALIGHAKSELDLLLTDRSEILEGTPPAAHGPVWVRSASATDDLDESLSAKLVGDRESSASSAGAWNWHEHHGWRLGWRQESLGSQVAKVLEELRIDDLDEPFERIREALDEAQRTARPTAARRVGEAA